MTALARIAAALERLADAAEALAARQPAPPAPARPRAPPGRRTLTAEQAHEIAAGKMRAEARARRAR